ncbi:16S rRNA (guanine(966)-N(2))-methyltransferase RsmD [uncultured Pelagimonas sp.]|uniref:16S rRNA (guanine(966)-N(2))-methyltransferase RsmD n=1 Tax=uncultured Pelagimonas sp. TaxID=1618102 RepID=UPI0026186299|nr:16S rRNA (guanine(966)-N(2))-methyltransferase RsmD [uncultured Pelagimonas sp.]
MRIIAGEFRGRRLASVGKGDAGAHLRPTTDRVRESLFNTLIGGRFGEPIEDVHVLDLFAGTGALGLEALSRGATHVTFVDDGRAAGKLIRDNIATLGCKAETKLISRDATRLPQADTACQLIFLDPPYGKELGEKALLTAHQTGWIASGALIVWEESSAQEAPDGFGLLDHKRYGDTWITFLEAQ